MTATKHDPAAVDNLPLAHQPNHTMRSIALRNEWWLVALGPVAGYSSDSSCPTH